MNSHDAHMLKTAFLGISLRAIKYDLAINAFLSVAIAVPINLGFTDIDFTLSLSAVFLSVTSKTTFSA